jgi:CheY-like chemotaxis protein
VGIEKRRHVRVAGPFDGFRVGALNTPVRIYDLSEGGCFVNSVHAAPAPGRPLVLKIDLPDEGWIYLTCEAVYAKPEFGFAVAFVDVPAEASDRLRRGLLRLRGLLPEAEQDRAIMLPACPRCRGRSVRPLGMARSSLPWFTCDSCGRVWAAREATPDEETPIADSPDAVTHNPGVKQILIADDDGAVLSVMVRALSDYHVLAARNISEALTLGRLAPLDLLITDYLMPDGTGEELIAKLRDTHPSLKTVMLTAHQGLLDDEGFGWWKHVRHLAKPCSLVDLRAAVTALIGSP